MNAIIGWQERTLGEIIELQGGFAFKSSDFEDDGIPIIRMSDLNNGILDTSRAVRIKETKLKSLSNFGLNRGDFIVGMSGSIGNFAIVRNKDLPAYLNQRVGRFRQLDKTNSDYEYITQIGRSQAYKHHIELLAAGAAQVNISPSQIESFRFSVPPKLEQTKIAEILSTVDRAIEQTEALIAKQQRLKNGLMQDLLTRGIDAHGNLRSEQTHSFKDSPLGRIPVEWEVTNLGNVSQISSGVTLGKAHTGPATIELPYLRVANVQDGYLDLTEVKTIRIPISSIDRFLLKEGDVLMNEGGDFDKLGRGSVWRGEIDKCLHQNHVFKVRPDSGALASEYLAAVSASPYGKAFFVKASKQSTNLASINSTQLKSFEIPLPSFDEQLRIEATFAHYRAVDERTLQYLTKLRALKTALMQDLLTGRKRVTPLLTSSTIL